MSDFYLALLLTTAAGLATSAGGALALAIRKPGPRFMSFTLGLSAGVMLLVSFVELLSQSIEGLGFGWAHVVFFCGMGAAFLADTVIPHSYAGEAHPGFGSRERKLLRTGLFVALGLGIHNFPEGTATFAATLSDANLGIAIAAAVALHNIPEGIAVAAPVYAATGSRARAFAWSTLSGVAEPVGALAGAALFLPFLNQGVLAVVLAVVAGMMVYIALDELLPASREFGHEHLSIAAAILGMGIMAASLGLLR